MNCNTPLKGPYCHACGQRSVKIDADFWHVILELLSETIDADGKLLSTLPLFLTQPGKLVRAFMQGRRARFMNPTRLLFFSLAVGFLCLGIGAGQTLDRAAESLEDKAFVLQQGPTPDEVIVEVHPEGGLSFSLTVPKHSIFEERLASLDGMNQRQAARVFVDGWLNVASMGILILLPGLTALLKLVYWRHSLLSHLVLSTLLHAQALLLIGLVAVTGLGWLFFCAVLWLHGQLLLGMRQVYEGTVFQTVWRFIPVTVGYWGLLIASTIVTMLGMLLGL